VIRTRPILTCFIAALCVATVAHAQARKRNPTSKLYVADLVGDSQIDTGTEIDDLTKRSVYNAEGTTIDTKLNSNVSVVLSNGTGIYFDVDTRVQIKAFEQEAFRPNRDDIEDEPSISNCRLYVDHGVIGLSTSKLVAGSNMTCETSLATAFIHGRQTVVLAQDNLTVISMVQGECTVQAGPQGRTYLVKNHQQAIVKPGAPGEANIVEIVDIQDGGEVDMRQWLEERVLTADSARKLVYFETQSRGAVGSGSSAGSGTGADGGITLFDGTGPTGSTGGTGGTNGVGGTDGTGGNEIVAVPVVPSNPTVQPNVSPANLTGP
jgi:hypothetical protein